MSKAKDKEVAAHVADKFSTLSMVGAEAEEHIGTHPASGIALCGAKDHEWRYGDPNTEATCAVCLDLWRNRSWWSRLLNKFRRHLP